MFASSLQVTREPENLVRLSVKETDSSVSEHWITNDQWSGMINTYRHETGKTLRIRIEVTPNFVKYYDVSTRDFMMLVAEYDLGEE